MHMSNIRISPRVSNINYYYMVTVDVDYLHRLNTKWPSLDSDISDYILLYTFFEDFAKIL